jgi:hypothetical protein
MTQLSMAMADRLTVTDAASRSAGRAAREIRAIVSGTLTAGAVLVAAGVQWSVRRAATVARRHLERTGAERVDGTDETTLSAAGARHLAR